MKMQKSSHPRILLTAPKSGSGKTLVTCALISAFKSRGFRVSACKCGPDYIDPMFHRAVSGVRAGNIDTFFTDDELTRAILGMYAENADLTILEGAMGYYDGMGGTSACASAYETAAVTDTPALLVVDAKGAALSLAAVIGGVLAFRREARTDSGICGVILNRVSEAFYPRLAGVIEENCGIPVFGYIPEKAEFAVPSRHLGLVAPDEIQDAASWMRELAECAGKTLDLDAILRCASAAPSIPCGSALLRSRFPKTVEHVRIAVARDEAFSFYYEENDTVLRYLGAELIPFSPLRDAALPEDTDGVILGGGYPELFAERLQDSPVRKQLSALLRGGMPCIAECGGFLFLQETLETADGRVFEMAGVLPGGAYPAGRLVRFGYLEARTGTPGLFGKAGTRLRGHEFHHWDTETRGTGMRLMKPLTGKEEAAVVYTDTLAAGFPHFYYPSCPDAAASFVKRCEEYGRGKPGAERKRC